MVFPITRCFIVICSDESIKNKVALNPEIIHWYFIYMEIYQLTLKLNYLRDNITL